jgi:hypothetical protein
MCTIIGQHNIRQLAYLGRLPDAWFIVVRSIKSSGSAERIRFRGDSADR